MKRIDASRREFLRTSSLLSVLGPAGVPFALNLATIGAAAAQTADDYRALVCVFFFGGNDHHNTVIATDTASWNEYQRLRSTPPDPIAFPAPGTACNFTPALIAASARTRSSAVGPRPPVEATSA